MSSPSLPDSADKMAGSGAERGSGASSGSRPRPPNGALTIHLDLVGGLAGDMFVAAVVDALPWLREPLLAELAAVQPTEMATPRFVAATTGTLRACRFGAWVAEGHHHRHHHDHDHGDDHGHRNRHDHGDDHGHRHRHEHGDEHGDGHRHHGATPQHADAHHHGTRYAELRDRVAAAPLTAPTRRHALALLARLGAAEARVHGIGIDDVHFHELADWDSLLDVVAAGCVAGWLEGAQWTASAPPLGGGMVRTAHGLLPVPTPATVELLAGYPWRDDGVGGERVTPTGAAILCHLVPAAACAGRPPVGMQGGGDVGTGTGRRLGGKLVAIGHGAGTRELPGIPNLTRVLVFERALGGGGATSSNDQSSDDKLSEDELSDELFDGLSDETSTADAVAVIEFDVDDMTGEEIGVAADRLRATPGVIDVTLGSRAGKKGRPVVDFRLLVRDGTADQVADVCFEETTTLGLRWREERRRVLPRSTPAAADAVVGVRDDGMSAGASDGRAVGRPDGLPTVKLAERPHGQLTAKAEHDEVADVAGLAQRRARRAAAEEKALRAAAEHRSLRAAAEHKTLHAAAEQQALDQEAK